MWKLLVTLVIIKLYVRIDILKKPDVLIEPIIQRSLIIEVKEKPYCTTVYMV